MTPYRIDITTKQQLIDPTGNSEWVFLDSLMAYTMALDFSTWRRVTPGRDWGERRGQR